MKQTVYIIGPMPGAPEQHHLAFLKAADAMRANGFDVANSGIDCMRTSIRALLECTHVALLPGYEGSARARLEHQIAMHLGMEPIFVPDESETQAGRLQAAGYQVDACDLALLEIAQPVKGGYLRVQIPQGGSVLLHRHITGAAHGQIVDHINRDRRDNRRSNLRLTDYAGNSQNSGLRKNNKSGVRGVHYHKRENRWDAQINFQGKRIYLGRFDEYEQAVAARQSKERELFGEFSPLSPRAGAVSSETT